MKDRGGFHPTHPQSRKAFETRRSGSFLLAHFRTIQPTPKAERRLRLRVSDVSYQHVDENPTHPQSRKAFETFSFGIKSGNSTGIQPTPKAERRLRLSLISKRIFLKFRKSNPPPKPKGV